MMDCTRCQLKGCRKHAPCTDQSIQYIDDYRQVGNAAYIKSAASLVDGGKAGKFNRLEEIAAYCLARGYSKIGIAYCYALEKESAVLREIMEQNGFAVTAVSCTVDGLSESRIDPDKRAEAVSCNPLGQANVLNRSGVDFTILVGLCLGHDLLIQKNLASDFTTLVVKDRVLSHNPRLALSGGMTEDNFMGRMPNDYYLVKPADLRKRIQSPDEGGQPCIIDLRNNVAYSGGHIEGALNCLLKDLPSRYQQLMPDRDHEVIFYCNGGIQSIYAVMYLMLKGYRKVFSLSGGYSAFRLNGDESKD